MLSYFFAVLFSCLFCFYFFVVVMVEMQFVGRCLLPSHGERAVFVLGRASNNKKSLLASYC